MKTTATRTKPNKALAAFKSLLTLGAAVLASLFATLASADTFKFASGSAYIDLPIEQCWEKLSYFGSAHNYVQNLTGTTITTDAQNGIGASRIVHHESAGEINETIIFWQEGAGFTIRLHRGEKDGVGGPIQKAMFTYLLETEGSGTRATLTMQYQLGWGWLGSKLGDWFIHDMMVSTNEDTAMALAHYYETEEPVTPEIFEQLKAARDKNN